VLSLCLPLFLSPSLCLSLSSAGWGVHLSVKAGVLTQVELLLTFEEFCSEEGIFEGTGERGKIFAAVFPQVRVQHPFLR
jgi:hypothetical protein